MYEKWVGFVGASKVTFVVWEAYLQLFTYILLRTGHLSCLTKIAVFWGILWQVWTIISKFFITWKLKSVAIKKLIISNWK